MITDITFLGYLGEKVYRTSLIEFYDINIHEGDKYFE